MTFLGKLVLAMIWMIVIPFCIGLLPCSLLAKEHRSWAVVSLTGYFTTFALLLLVELPVLLLTPDGNFTILVIAFTVLQVIAGCAGMVLCGGRGGVQFRKDKPDLEEVILWVIFLILLGFELYMAFTHASFDGDDAFYVVESVLADEKNTMYRILPYTGGATSLDLRHALAGFPMWMAYIARMSGAHATIITHSIMPLLLIPLCDLCYYLLAGQLFHEEKKARVPGFMILIALLQIFGNVSIYTPETFLLMRTWQGKSVFVNLIVPAAILLLFYIARSYREEAGESREKKFLWVFMVLLNMSAGLCTSMAVVLVAMLLFVSAFFISFALHNKRIFWYTVAACIPNALYMVLFLYLNLVQ